MNLAAKRIAAVMLAVALGLGFIHMPELAQAAGLALCSLAVLLVVAVWVIDARDGPARPHLRVRLSRPTLRSPAMRVELAVRLGPGEVSLARAVVPNDGQPAIEALYRVVSQGNVFMLGSSVTEMPPEGE